MNGPLDFAERFQLSDFVVANMTNLVGKAYGVKDPSHLVSESGIKKMKLRRRKACLENHKVKTKKLIGLQVINLVEFALRDHPFKTSACYRGGGVKNLPNLP